MDYNAGSGEVPEGWTELEIASAGQRLVGWAVDFFIWVLVGIVACGLGLLVGGFALEEDSFLALNEEVFAMVVVLVLLGYVAVYLAMVGMSGQSPGKKLVGVKIVRGDGRALGFVGMVVREVVGKMIPGGHSVAEYGVVAVLCVGSVRQQTSGLARQDSGDCCGEC